MHVNEFVVFVVPIENWPSGRYPHLFCFPAWGGEVLDPMADQWEKAHFVRDAAKTAWLDLVRINASVSEQTIDRLIDNALRIYDKVGEITRVA